MPLRIVIAEPYKPAEIREVDGSLESLQTLVGGYIEAYTPEPFRSRGLLLYVNENGFRECRHNRLVGTWLRGPIVVVATDGENEASLTDDDAAFAIRVLNEAPMAEKPN